MVEAPELRAEVARSVSEVSSKVNTETGFLSIVEDVSQEPSQRISVSGDLKIPDSPYLRTSESDRAAKAIEDELFLPVLSIDVVSEA